MGGACPHTQMFQSYLLAQKTFTHKHVHTYTMQHTHMTFHNKNPQFKKVCCSQSDDNNIYLWCFQFGHKSLISINYNLLFKKNHFVQNLVFIFPAFCAAGLPLFRERSAHLLLTTRWNGGSQRGACSQNSNSFLGYVVPFCDLETWSIKPHTAKPVSRLFLPKVGVQQMCF